METIEFKTDINGTTYTFIKKWDKIGVFTYSCGRVGKDSQSWTGFETDRDLEPGEIERLPQFDNFIGR